MGEVSNFLRQILQLVVLEIELGQLPALAYLRGKVLQLVETAVTSHQGLQQSDCSYNNVSLVCVCIFFSFEYIRSVYEEQNSKIKMVSLHKGKSKNMSKILELKKLAFQKLHAFPIPV